MQSLHTLINYMLLKKLIKSGKQSSSLTIQRNFTILMRGNNILKLAVLKLLVPVSFKIKKIGYIKYKLPILIHYYSSIKVALTWLFKAANSKNSNKFSFIKALYLECHNVLKEQGVAYTLKQQYIKKALINRIFVYLLKYKTLK